MSKFVAYVGSYTYIGKSKGITILDMDTEKHTLIKREEIEAANASYVMTSADHKVLYSITDEGVISFQIQPDGSLKKMNTAKIRGMRGRFMDISPNGKFIAVGGYHDGKTTMLKLKEDGSVGRITDGIYNQGMGSIAERDSQPHVSCVRFTPDGKYLCSIDLGLDYIKVFRIDYKTGKLSVAHILHCNMQSAPHQMVFSKDGRFLYVICQMSNSVSVYSYSDEGNQPQFTLLQSLPTVGKRSLSSSITKALHLDITSDDRHLFYSSAGDNCIGMYDRDPETGLLTHRFSLPISGRFPKDFFLMPGEDHICSVNYEEGTLTFFAVNYEKGLIVMNAAPVKIDQPNCGVIVEIEG
ncbi:MAG: beta-propeller fold lactonase family protein [Lachnospiraceae bacterium]|nr:beta-propeller fold lactonase family protein [Lachnospiraceae bacterium]